MRALRSWPAEPFSSWDHASHFFFLATAQKIRTVRDENQYIRVRPPPPSVPRGSRIFSMFFSTRSTQRPMSKSTVVRCAATFACHALSRRTRASLRSAHTSQLEVLVEVLVLVLASSDALGF